MPGTPLDRPSARDARGGVHDHSDRRGFRATRGAAIGFAIDCYDIYLPVITVAPALGFFLAQDDASPATMGLMSGLIFAATLIGRPVGAVIFGSVADTLGRRRATLIAMYGCAIGTAVLTVLPGYDHIGLASVLLLVLLRLVTGVFLGGQYTGAVPLAMESSPARKRGLYGGLITMGFPLAFCVVSALTYLVMSLGGGAAGSFYQVWGWRIPVAIGALLTFGFAVYYGRTVDESPVFREARQAVPGRKPRHPALQLLSGQGAKSLRQVFLMMTGVWIVSNATSASFPVTLRALPGISSQQGTLVMVVAELSLILAYPLTGALSQRVGRRPVLIVCGVLAATAAPLLYLAIVSYTGSSVPLLIVLTMALMLTSICCFGCTAAYLSERFPTRMRATGYGVGYSVAVIIPSFYGFYESGLSAFMTASHTTTVLYVVGGILLAVGAALGPETRNVDLGPEAHR
ncbi:MFS transporter [Amycolatopsis endophytica]|uniref:MFS family permease n=1 Tax=Amycolatopsis endophytica TaxID=860233 RepID=A0A853BCI5_9PSEU|nr:MFS transporter [Amycolatopsis endophytica]NYI92381.1 MFS family permease [Amycolatopsis endophytica]